MKFKKIHDEFEFRIFENYNKHDDAAVCYKTLLRLFKLGTNVIKIKGQVGGTIT